MKQGVFCALISLTLAVFIPGSSSGEMQDRPLPMSQENIEKLYVELQAAAKSIAPSPSQDGAELMVGAFKMVIEKKMGFSFDKTLRSVMLFYPSIPLWQLMTPTINYVNNDPKMALDKGFISQRTFDIIDTGSKAKAELTKEGEEFLGFVTECQKKNNGICNSKSLLGVIADHNVFPDIASSSGKSELEKTSMVLDYLLNQKYNFAAMGINKWITKPDGQDLNTNFLFDDLKNKFVVNTKQIEISKTYANMLAEEKVALSQ